VDHTLTLPKSHSLTQFSLELHVFCLAAQIVHNLSRFAIFLFLLTKMAMLVSRGAKRFISSAVQDFYKLSAIALNGEEIDFSKYKGKVVLIQNTASL
jgi:hypothetical protein